MINKVTQDVEVPGNGKLLFTKRHVFNYEGKDYEIVIKSSKKALFEFPSTMIYSITQVLHPPSQGDEVTSQEVFCEFYKAKLTTDHAQKIIDAIIANPKNFIDTDITTA